MTVESNTNLSDDSIIRTRNARRRFGKGALVASAILIGILVTAALIVVQGSTLPGGMCACAADAPGGSACSQLCNPGPEGIRF
jgi:hypothetical protein